MNGRDAMLGMETAWRRFEAQSGRRAGSGAFERLLRELESRAESFNLTPDAVHLAAEIAALEPNLDENQRIALILLIVVSLAALQEGSTRFPVTGPQAREPMRRMIAALCGDAFGAGGAETMFAAIGNLLASGAAGTVIGSTPADYKPLLYLPPFIYHQRIRAAEGKLASRLAALLTAKARPAIDEASLEREIDKVAAWTGVSGAPVELSEEQRTAVALAAASHLTVISGGPGTGKTSIVLAIIRLLLRLGVPLGEVALAAPTGKAAYRMRESICAGLAQLKDRGPQDDGLMNECPQPSTIHRLLGFSPSLGRFRHHRNNPLSALAVIVDEGSMLDLTLMERLLEAVRLEARLIILGDSDQLPSVAAGAVFRDLAAPASGDETAASRVLASASVRLRHNYRMDPADPAGRAISLLARGINEGDANLLDGAGRAGEPLLARRASAEQLEFTGVELLGGSAWPSGAFLDRWYAERVAGDALLGGLKTRVYTSAQSGFDGEERESLERLFAHLNRARLLCVTRVLDSGADRINARLHRRAARDADRSERERFIAGEPILVTRNDYERMLFNGDQGVVLRVRRAGAEAAAMAVFPRADNFAAFRLDALRDDLDLCYAMTVHKAQGSEFDSVAVILPERDLPILTREILYTAVSRARRSVILVGEEELLRAGIARKIERYSGLGELLEAAAAGPARTK